MNVELEAARQREAEILDAAEQLVANQRIVVAVAEQRAVKAVAATVNPIVKAHNPMVTTLTEKMAKMKILMSKVDKGSTRGIDIDKFCIYPNAKLPHRFKMPDFSKFDRSSDPNTNLYGYYATMKLHGVENNAMVQMFPQIFSRPVFQWFISIDMSKRRTWKDIGEAFVTQYSYNTQLKMSTQELESTKMKAKENFPDFVRRWKSKATLMTDRLSNKDQFFYEIRPPSLLPALAN